MRLTPTELEKVLTKWERLFAPEGESEHQFLYSLICEAEDAKGIQGHLPELKPDRRAEVLELAGRLVVGWVTSPSGDLKIANAPKFVDHALAIINAVDEATGARATETDAVSGFMTDIEAELDWLSLEIGRSMSLSEGDKPEFQRHVSKARAAWLAARGVKP